MKLALWEIWSYVQAPLIWYLFLRLARRDIKGEIVAGALLGLYIEFSTAPLWNYHFRITFYKDTPPSVPIGWGVMFAMTAFFSEKLYLRAFRLSRVESNDKRLLLCDVITGILIGVPLETLGLRSGVWDYNYAVLGWNWGQMPVLQIPYEALLGYALLMLVAPSYVRHWRKGLIA